MERDRLQTLIDVERNFLNDRYTMAANNTNPEWISKAVRNEATELIEAVTAYSLTNSKDDLLEIGQEIADVFKFLLSLCFIYKFDIYEEVMTKHAWNMVRFPSSAFSKGNDYESSYKAQKQVVKRDGMKDHFYS